MFTVYEKDLNKKKAITLSIIEKAKNKKAWFLLELETETEELSEETLNDSIEQDNDLTSYVIELVEYSSWSDDYSFYLTEHYERVREIGNEIYEKHGVYGMAIMIEFIYELLPEGSSDDLSKAWIGIGEWVHE